LTNGHHTTAPVTARYRYDRRSGRWWWSPELHALYGTPAGVLEPTTEHLVAGFVADDRARVLDALAVACRGGTTFAVQARLLRGDGALRVVTLVGEPDLDESGGVSAVDGLVVDVTGSLPADDDRLAALTTEVEQLRAAMASRAAIEQAKGILMLLTSCTDQVAFDLLAHISSHTHRKVRDIAVAIVESASGHGALPPDVREILRDACPPGH
jgi:hypothetical protein